MQSAHSKLTFSHCRAAKHSARSLSLSLSGSPRVSSARRVIKRLAWLNRAYAALAQITHPKLSPPSPCLLRFVLSVSLTHDCSALRQGVRRAFICYVLKYFQKQTYIFHISYLKVYSLFHWVYSERGFPIKFSLRYDICTCDAFGKFSRCFCWFIAICRKQTISTNEEILSCKRSKFITYSMKQSNFDKSSEKLFHLQ